MMDAYKISLRSADELAHALERIGSDKRSLPFFENRRDLITLMIQSADVRAANIIKQEMLSVGGDAAVHAHAVDCGVKESAVMLFGTKQQILGVAEKINTMKWWGFPKICADIKTALAGPAKRSRAGLPCGASLSFGARTLIMGIVNLTDDSFFAASRTGGNADTALKMAAELASGGADIIDLGAESTRPGSARVTEDEEKKRISEAVRLVRRELPQTPISIDTTRASVARAALEEGADIINDISGLTYDSEIAKVSAEYGAMLVLMHMRGTPETMNAMCQYSDILFEINQFFEKQISAAESLGLDRSRIILDPGLGFAKNYEQNLYVLRHVEAFRSFGLPLLIGASRKSFIGRASHADSPSQRLEGTLAVTSLCAWLGVDIVRVHDAAANKKAADTIAAVKEAYYV
jgi:dihydropteroate synthase